MMKTCIDVQTRTKRELWLGHRMTQVFVIEGLNSNFHKVLVADHVVGGFVVLTTKEASIMHLQPLSQQIPAVVAVKSDTSRSLPHSVPFSVFDIELAILKLLRPFLHLYQLLPIF